MRRVVNRPVLVPWGPAYKDAHAGATIPVAVSVVVTAILVPIATAYMAKLA